tara:strand:+ start:1512 stop:1646 length:135 start_codon:yes stop_codon:yes gene_type:complete
MTKKIKKINPWSKAGGSAGKGLIKTSTPGVYAESPESLRGAKYP